MITTEAIEILQRMANDGFYGNHVHEALKMGIDALEKQKEHFRDDTKMMQKPLSTEETELNSIAFLEQIGYTCIPPGKEQKPVEWSKEDETCLENVLWCIEKVRHCVAKDVCDFDACKSAKRFIESLKPHWKPSEYTLSLVKK